MKYILWPIYAITIMLSTFIIGAIRFALIPAWHFRMPTLREAFTFHDEYLFDNWSWKTLFRIIFDYDYAQRFMKGEEDEE